MNITKNIWLIGAAAGFATVMLLVSSGVTAGGSFLSFFVPLPGLIAGLAYGWPVAGIAGLIGAIFFFVLSSGLGGLIYAILVAVPTTLLSQIIGLWRPDASARFSDSFRSPPPTGKEHEVEWYPLSGVLMWLTLLAGALGVFSTLSFGVDHLTYKANVHELVDTLIDQSMQPILQQEFTAEQRVILKENTAKFLPACVAASWMLVMILNTWIAGKVARASSTTARPAPDTRMVELPQIMVIGLGVMLLIASLDGLPGRAAMAFVGATVFAMFLIGLAVVHEWTLGNAARPLILGLLYAGLLPFWVFALPLLVALGLAESFLGFRHKIRARRHAQQGPPPTGPSD